MTAIYKPTTAPEYCNASPAFCPALQSPCGFCLLLRIHHIRLSCAPNDHKKFQNSHGLPPSSWCPATSHSSHPSLLRTKRPQKIPEQPRSSSQFVLFCSESSSIALPGPL